MLGHIQQLYVLYHVGLHSVREYKFSGRLSFAMHEMPVQRSVEVAIEIERAGERVVEFSLGNENSIISSVTSSSRRRRCRYHRGYGQVLKRF